MFWPKKKNTDKRKTGGKAAAARDSAALREQAMANARAARAHIGEETLDRIAAAMAKKQQSATEKAKAEIEKADPTRVREEIRFLMKD